MVTTKRTFGVQGDSGGPLIFPLQAGNANFVYYLGGVVSFGVKCADLTYPGVSMVSPSEIFLILIS